jgi:hypothetical protein
VRRVGIVDEDQAGLVRVAPAAARSTTVAFRCSCEDGEKQKPTTATPDSGGNHDQWKAGLARPLIPAHAGIQFLQGHTIAW